AKRSAQPAPVVANSGLRRKLSATLRDQLLRDIEDLNTEESAAVWARRKLPAKNTLHEADAGQVEEAFRAKLAEINDQSNRATGSDPRKRPQQPIADRNAVTSASAAKGRALESIDKSELAHPEPRRVRDKDHLRFVATQPCLVCGRKPA